MATCTISDAGGTWSLASCWVDGIPPTSTDDVVAQADGTSGNVTCNGGQCKTLNFTNYSGTFTVSGYTYIYDDITLSPTMTFVNQGFYTYTISTTVNLTSNGCHMTGTGTIIVYGNSTTLKLLDALTMEGYIYVDNANTWNSNTKVLTFDGTGGGISYDETGTPGTVSLYDIVVTKPAVASSTFYLKSGISLRNLTLTGNSAIYRMIFYSGYGSTSGTITSTGTVTGQYLDIRNVTAGSAWNLSAITGGSGDLGKNSNITFTSATTQHWTNTAGGNWSTIGNWTSRVPLVQDTVVMDCAFGNNISVTMDTECLGGSIDWSGATWTGTLTWVPSTPNAHYCGGSITFKSGMLDLTSTCSITIYNSGTVYLDVVGITNIYWQFLLYGFGTGTLTLASAFTGVNTLYADYGTLDTGGYNVTCSEFGSSTSTAIYNLNNSNVTFVASTYYMAGTNTWNCGTSTVTFSASTFSWYLTSTLLTFYNVIFSGNVTIGLFSGTPVVACNKLTLTAGKSLTLYKGMTLTTNEFVAVGTGASKITIKSDTASTAANIVSAGSDIRTCDYVLWTDIACSGTGKWYGGANSGYLRTSGLYQSAWIKNYTKASSGSLPATDAELTDRLTICDNQEVSSLDTVYDVEGTVGANVIYLFKNKGDVKNVAFTVNWRGKSNYAPTSSTVYLQAYDRVTGGGTWVEIAHNDAAAANEDFTLTGSVTVNPSNYYDSAGIISCRVYQVGA